MKRTDPVTAFNQRYPVGTLVMVRRDRAPAAASRCGAATLLDGQLHVMVSGFGMLPVDRVIPHLCDLCRIGGVDRGAQHRIYHPILDTYFDGADQHVCTECLKYLRTLPVDDWRWDGMPAVKLGYLEAGKPMKVGA
jgi:hypothetical protein